MKRGAAVVVVLLALAAVATSCVEPLPPTPAEMELIPAGCFRMGNSFGEKRSDELPVHTVSVGAVYMDRFEITKAQWDEVATWAAANGYDIGPADGDGVAADHPVFNVSWYEAVKWANARSERERLMPCYTVGGTVYRTGQSGPDCDWSADGYRLPTEAEWEKAARGGTEGHRFPWSDTDTIQHARANYMSNSFYTYDTSPTRGYHPDYAYDPRPYTSPVGSFAPNGYGLYDMAGNMGELCWDWYDEAYYTSSPGRDPRGPTGSELWAEVEEDPIMLMPSRVVRGGGWNAPAYYSRVAFRFCVCPVEYGRDLGFRLVRSVP